MGVDICCLSKHNFTFNDPEKLMIELSERFNANVFHVFGSYINFDEYLERMDDYNLTTSIEVEGYIINKHIISPDAPNLTLEHDDYMYLFLHLQFGEEAGTHPEFVAHWTDDPVENEDTIQFFIREMDTFTIYFEDFSLWLSKETADLSSEAFYFGRWWDLIRTLIEGDEHRLMDRFVQFRNRNKEIAKMIGGTNCYYLSDQNKHTGIGQGNEWSMTWNEIEEELNSDALKPHFVDLVKLLTDTDYKSEITFKDPEDPKEYCIFYDDLGEIAELPNIN